MQSYDSSRNISQKIPLKNLSLRTTTPMIISDFQNGNLSLGIRVYAAVPEAGGNVGETVVWFGGCVVGDFVETLVGRGRIQRAEMLNVGTDLDIVKSHVERPLDIAAAGIERRRKPDLPDMVSKGDQSLRIISLAEEQEAIDPVIIRDELVDDLIGELFTDIFLQERRVAPNAITLAVADVNRQGNPVRYLLNDHRGHLGDIFNHIFVFST